MSIPGTKMSVPQVHWWLCFIKSCNPNRQPYVILVASHADKVAISRGQRRAACVVQIMTAEFKAHLRIADEVLLMNCRKTWTPEMDQLKAVLGRIREAMLQRQRDMSKLCAKIMECLPKWRKSSKTSPKCPVMMWPAYVEEVKGIDRFVTEDFLQKSTRFLHHLGEILFITPPTSDPIIVLKPNWLGSDVFGPMMAPDYFHIRIPKRTSKDYVTRDEIQRVFQDVADVDLLITLLQEFQLCHSYDGLTFIFPGLLTQTMPPDSWQPTPEPKVIYFGKQVQCADSTDMFSSGFFPRVQTRLMRELENRPLLSRDGAKCVDKNVECLIKLSPDGRTVNICVRSVEGDKVQCGKMLKQLDNIIADVLDECSPGTGTVEKVLSARALKEHRKEFYSYGKEEIDKATTEGGTIVHPILGFTEQVSDLLCREDEGPLTRYRPESAEGLRNVEPVLKQISTEGRGELDTVGTEEKDDRQSAQKEDENSLTRNRPKFVQASRHVGQILEHIPTEEQYDIVRANSTPRGGASALLDTLGAKGEDARQSTQKIDEDLLTRNRPELVRALGNLEPIMDHLRARGILTMDECYVIRANSTPQDCVRALLDIVETKGENEQFKAVLREVDPHAAHILMRPKQPTDELQNREGEDPLTRHRPELVQALRPVEPILDELYSREVLSTEECNIIRAKSTPENRARALLDIVGTKGREACQKFKAALEKEKPDAAEMMLEAGRGAIAAKLSSPTSVK